MRVAARNRPCARPGAGGGAVLAFPHGGDRQGSSPPADVPRCYRPHTGRGKNAGMTTENPGKGPDETPEGGDPRQRVRADLAWYLRHADALSRWPVIGEAWARAVERLRDADRERRGGW